MHIIGITPVSFYGKRESRNTVSKLSKDNDFSLNEINQRKINKAIEDLAKVQSESNVKFLLNTAKTLKYGTNIESDKISRNDWKQKLNNAVTDAIKGLPEKSRTKYEKEAAKIFGESKALSQAEERILKNRDSILSKIDKDAVSSFKDKNERNLENNLEYFIVSSETTIKQKDYILDRLAFFMSDDYKINPQLKDKKTKVLAEILNDLVITTPESETPNIKSVNQRSHGACADISISRKALAYEDKPNYVDAVLSELDDSDFVMVYDRTNLGSKKRIPVMKADIDYDYATAKGYRIVDSACLNWMQIAQMYGANNEVLDVYNAFDKENFDVYNDTFFNPSTDNPEFAKDHAYYQSLVKAKEVIGDVKASGILRNEKDKNIRNAKDETIAEIGQYAGAIRKNIQSVISDVDKADEVFNSVLSLEVSNSDKLYKDTSDIKQYKYIPNEESSVKKDRISKLLSEKFGVTTASEELDKVSENLLGLVSTYNKLKTQTSTNSLKQKEITTAKQMYSAEAAYRNQFVQSLQIPEIRDYYMTEFNMCDTESEILNGFNYLIDRLEKDDSDKLVNIIANKYQTEPDKEKIINRISSMAMAYEDMVTNGLDAMYGMCLNGDRITVLNNNIEVFKEAIQTADDKRILDSARVLNIKPDKKVITEKLNLLQQNLNEESYNDTINALGVKSQADVFLKIYEPMKTIIMSNDDARQAFNTANGIKPNAPIAETVAALKNIDNMYEIMSDLTANYLDLLETKDENGKEIYPVRPETIIIRKMENKGTLIPASTMEKLRNRFTKIDYVKNEDHMNGKRGKISDKSLLILSQEEKDAIKKISSDLNKKYDDVNKDLTDQLRKIRTPLNELKKYIGLNTGMYWVQPEGSSGLFAGPQVKIFEQLTDRPYYEEKDKRKSIDKMRNSDYSGISSTSVSNNYPGMHAQYVADIVDTDINGEQKEVLYHDNTWGACENENTWVDSAGMTRTDYSCERGGVLGYVTNDRMFNGNIVDNMMKKGEKASQEVESRNYRKLKGNGGSFKFDMYSGAIVSGSNPEAKSIVASIKDNVFASSLPYMKTLENEASKMTKAQLLKTFERVENAGQGYKIRYKSIKEQIDADDKVKTADDFNNVFGSENIKLSLEKVAARQSLHEYDLYEEIAAAKTVEDLNAIKQKQIDAVNKKFEYAFAKNKNIALNITKTHQQESLDVLAKTLNSDGLNVDDKTLIQILDAAANIPDDKFDGSLKNTINTMCKNISEAISKEIPSIDTNKIKDIETSMNKYMHIMLDFNSSDINNTSSYFEKIKKIIDKKYDPETNGEFIKIYKLLQNMTSEEFSEVMNDVNLEDKGLKTVTAYDVFNKIKNDDNSTKTELKNSLYYEELIKDMKFSDTRTEYQYEKFYKKTNGVYYKNGKRTFDDVYRDFYFALSSMEMDKLARKMFDSGVREHGVFPAFPSVEVTNKEEEYKQNCEILNEIIDTIFKVNSFKELFELSDISDMLAVDLEKINSGNKLSNDEFDSVNKNLARAAALLANETSCADVLQSIGELLSADKSGQNKDISEYSKVINGLIKTIQVYKTMIKGESLDNLVSETNKTIKSTLNDLVSSNIILRYVPKVNSDISKWLHAEYKNLPEAKDLYETVTDDLSKYSKLNYPTELLKEYLCSKTTDNNTNYGDQKTIQLYCKNLLTLANIVEMQEILMGIVSSGDMSSVKKQLHEKTVEFTDKNGNDIVYTMDSDEIMNAMVDSLMLSNDVSVAVMFTEKLGITDKMVKLKTNSVNFENCTKALDKLEKTIRSQKEQYKIIDKEFTDKISIINEDNYSEIIDSLKKDVSDKTGKMHYRYALKKFNELMDAMKKQLDADCSTPPAMLAEGYKALFMQAMNDFCADKINTYNDSINPVISIYNYVNSLYIPEYSESFKIKEEFLNKYDQLSYDIQTKINKVFSEEA